MIEFGKSYFYTKENKIVFPLVIEEEKIICTDKQGETVIVLNQSYLKPTAAPKKSTVIPNFKPKPKVAIIPKVPEKAPVITKDTVEAKTAGEPAPDTSVNVAPQPEPVVPVVEPTTIAVIDVPQKAPVYVPVITRDDEPELAITRTVVMPTTGKIRRRKPKVIVTEKEDYI